MPARSFCAAIGHRPGVSTPRHSRTAVWLFGFALLCFVYFLPRWHDWNQDARLDMTMSVVNHGTIAIDAYHWNTGDDDFYKGHYYSNKAPGQSLLGVPVYVVYKGLLELPPVRSLVNAIERNSAWNLALEDGGDRFVPPKLDFAILQYVESVFTVAVPAALFLVLFFWFLGFLSASIVNRAFLSLALGLATIVFPYAQLFYSHVPAMALEFAGFALVYILAARGRHGRGQWIVNHPSISALLAGLCLGGAVVFEYPTAIISALIGLYALIRLPRTVWPYLIAGVAPALATVMAYDYAAYHSPFTTGYSGNSVLWKQEGQGIAGFTWPPRWTAITGMSYSPYRGLFFLSPFLLLALPGYGLLAHASWRKGDSAWLVFLAIPVAFFFAIAMYWGWFAGQVVGPRYLIPMLPFLALPIIFLLNCLRSLPARGAVAPLVAVSLFNVWAETLGSRAYPHSGTMNPLFTFSLPALGRGEVPMNLGMFLGPHGPTSLLPLLGLLILWTLASLGIPRAKFALGTRRAAPSIAGARESARS